MHITDPRFLNILRCPECGVSELTPKNEDITCQYCSSVYQTRNSTIFFSDKNLAEQHLKYETESKYPINRLKDFIKQSPWFFQFLTYTIGSISYLGLSPRRSVIKAFGEKNLKDKVILNIGSGIKKIHPEVINLDIFPFKGVDIVADATRLPFKDGSVDMIITESTLEHIPNSYQAMEKMTRVIKPGGYIYVSIPFLMPFHASPNDYGRLTIEGLKYNFMEFEPIKSGMRGGPVSALITFLIFFIPLPLSVISKSLYQFSAYIVMIFLTPLRIFDLIFYIFPQSIDVAGLIYFLGKKKIN